MAGEQHPIKFKISRVDRPTLRSDLSNIAEVATVDLRQAIVLDGGQAVRQRLVSDMVQAFNQGNGIDATTLPEPLVQLGLECQTMALLNGTQAWRGKDTVRPFVARIPDIRRKALAHSGFSLDGSKAPDDSAIYSMRAVGEVLEEEGLLSPHRMATNPVQVARQLSKNDTFLGVSKDDRFHAFTVVPVKGATAEKVAWMIDSLGGRQRYLSANELLNMVLGQQPTDYFGIYEVLKKLPDAPNTK